MYEQFTDTETISMPPTCTLETYSTRRLVRVPVGSVRSEETEKCSFVQLDRNVESAPVGCAEKWQLKAENSKTLGKLSTYGKITAYENQLTTEMLKEEKN